MFLCTGFTCCAGRVQYEYRSSFVLLLQDVLMTMDHGDENDDDLILMIMMTMIMAMLLMMLMMMQRW